jgi:ribosome recycling factor
MSRNDITGDRLINKTLTKEGEDNWDKIFGKKIKEQKLSLDDMKEMFDDKFREEKKDDKISTDI